MRRSSRPRAPRPGAPRPGASTDGKRVRPVYEHGLSPVFRPRPPSTANTGLLYDRYANIWSGAEGSWKPKEPRRGQSVRQAYLAEIVEHADGVGPHVEKLLGALHERRKRLWEALGAKEIELTLAAPLVSGLGMTHALDAGFVWDRNLGVPYLPATSLKGVARAWALDWSGLDERDALRIFGDLRDQGAGSVVFHALYPAVPPRLRIDVLNPHFQDYYRRIPSKQTAPGDWLSLVPVFFLTVPAGTGFLTALHLRPGFPSDDLGQAEQCLREALAELGAAGKNAAGYGHFEASIP
jgi:CRISPR-associated protein Cmr6